VRWQQLVLIAAARGEGNASGDLYSYAYRDFRELEPAGGIDGDRAIRRGLTQGPGRGRDPW
jgi:hypothetical protein